MPILRCTELTLPRRSGTLAQPLKPLSSERRWQSLNKRWPLRSNAQSQHARGGRTLFILVRSNGIGNARLRSHMVTGMVA